LFLKEQKKEKDNREYGSTTISIGCSVIGDGLNDVGMFSCDESNDQTAIRREGR